MQLFDQYFIDFLCVLNTQSSSILAFKVHKSNLESHYIQKTKKNKFSLKCHQSTNDFSHFCCFVVNCSLRKSHFLSSGRKAIKKWGKLSFWLFFWWQRCRRPINWESSRLELFYPAIFSSKKLDHFLNEDKRSSLWDVKSSQNNDYWRWKFLTSFTPEWTERICSKVEEDNSNSKSVQLKW